MKLDSAMRKRFVLGLLTMLLCYSFGMAQKTYTVTGNGDGGLLLIAKKNNISLEQLREWNNKCDDLVKKGDVYYVEDPKEYTKNAETQLQFDSNMELNKSKEEFGDTNGVVSSGDSNTLQNDTYANPSGKTNPRFWWFWLIIGIITGAFIWEIGVRKRIIRDKENQNSPKQNLDNSFEIGSLKNEIQKLTKEKHQLKKKVESLEEEKGELLEENIRLGERMDDAFSRNIDEKASNNNHNTYNKCSDVLYADFINEGCFSRVTEIPNDDSNFELHLKNEKTAAFIIYLPAMPRIVSNPAAFLQGCDKQVLGQIGEVAINREGLAQYDTDDKWKVINKLNVIIK